jgi:hypothetical protein
MTSICVHNLRKPVSSFSAFLTPSCHLRRRKIPVPARASAARWSRRKPPSRATGCLKQIRPFCFTRGSDAPACGRRDEPVRADRRQKISQRRRAAAFIKAANRADPETRLFCLVLGWSGGRISEVLALTPAAIETESGVANISMSSENRLMIWNPFERDVPPFSSNVRPNCCRP